MMRVGASRRRASTAALIVEPVAMPVVHQNYSVVDDFKRRTITAVGSLSPSEFLQFLRCDGLDHTRRGFSEPRPRPR